MDASDVAHVRIAALVEDHPDMRALVRLLLERRPGFSIDAEATTAAEAIDAVDGDPGPGVIILDQNLDGPMTGLELAPLLKDRAPQLRIVLFTAHDLEAEAARSPHVDRYLRKDRITELPDLCREVSAVVAS